MREVWLRPNRRALVLSMLAPLAVAGGGLALAAGGGFFLKSPLLVALGGAGLLLGLLGVGGLLWMVVSPRLAYQDEQLLVYLGRAEPYRVPIELVEIFFPGQGPSMLPRQWGQPRGKPSETSNVIVRLSEKAESWHRRPVNPWFGQWCDGYITIRGTWCEPLKREVFEHLNGRLVEVHRLRRTGAAGERASGEPASGEASVERREG